MISTILLIVAFVMLIMAAIHVPALGGKVDWFPLGMAMAVLSRLAVGF